MRMDTRARLGVLGAALVVLVGLGLALHHPGAENIRPMWRVYAFVGLLVLGGGVYALAVRQVLRAPAPHALWIVLIVAAVPRIALIPATPFLSSDVYRYVWDGRVQAAGINPYQYIPADPALARLRDNAIYPHINRRDYAPTIYPPMAQLIFRAVASLSDRVVVMKAAMVAFEAMAIWAVIRTLTLLRLPCERVLIYAWNPLAIWAFAGNGHVDAAAIGLLGIALLLRTVRRDAALGAILAGAVLVKFLPIAVLPALWRRWDWRLPLAFFVSVALLYGTFIGAGWKVLGFLPSYGGEEGLSGEGFYVLAALHQIVALPSFATRAYLALAACVLGALALRFAILSRPLSNPAADAMRAIGHASVLAAAIIVALSPHYSWYFVWLALPACICPYASVIFLSVAPAIQYLNPWDERFIWPSLVFVPFAVLALRDLRRHAGGRIGRLEWQPSL